ncbi:MAG: two-component system, OmpR family, sensor histidine kinase KdpD, partial [Actinomycetota bacterium]|nr:two-component system, OmpR family, sensor histidine kinase KdpD [Actinomycetota bacterium]
MAERDTGNRPLVTLEQTAELLQVPTDVVRSLLAAGYLAASRNGTDGPEFALVDVKAYLARNADNGSGNMLEALERENVDPQGLLDALDGKSEEMARRAFEIFASAFPESSGWSMTEQGRFIDQAKARFEAILAVTGQGAEVDEALVGDLQDVGASAAWAGSPLPQLLVVLRISRDLVVQTAVELAEERGRHWGLALSLLLTRVLPAMDRLTDSLAQGYWAAMIGREEESRARYENVVERSSDGIYEVDLDGRIQYANGSLAIILGCRMEELEDARLGDVLRPVPGGGSLEALMQAPEGTSQRNRLTVMRPDGVRRVLDISTMARYQDNELVGYEGVAHDVTAALDLEAEKNEFLTLVTYDLRNPLTTILGLGATLESHSDELPTDRIRRMGGSIRRHAERIARLADDLYDMSRLESHTLLLSPRPVEVANVVDDALASVAEPGNVQVRVPAGVTVQADPRRLEQVVGNLVDNALQHGAPPVVVSLVGTHPDGSVELAVIDRGRGVEPA